MGVRRSVTRTRAERWRSSGSGSGSCRGLCVRTVRSVSVTFGCVRSSLGSARAITVPMAPRRSADVRPRRRRAPPRRRRSRRAWPAGPPWSSRATGSRRLSTAARAARWRRTGRSGAGRRRDCHEHERAGHDAGPRDASTSSRGAGGRQESQAGRRRSRLVVVGSKSTERQARREARTGGTRPRCAQAAAVATRPRGVRASSPARTRNGSATSSTVSRSSPTATASVDSPTGPPPKRRQQGVEHRPVEPVEAEVVDVVDGQRGAGDARVTWPSARPGRSRGPAAAAGWRSGGCPATRPAISAAASCGQRDAEQRGRRDAGRVRAPSAS